MKLLNGILRPGSVLEVLENGKIKASAPGLFTEVDKELNPPIMPFWELMGSHSNTFSSPLVGDEVWILNLTDNPLQLFWFRKDPHTEQNSEIFQEIGSSANVEILCNREAGMGYASIYFSDGTGWVIKNDDSKIQICKDGSIEIGMNTPHRKILINQNNIDIGGNNSHSACYGDETYKILTQICGVLEGLATAAKTNPYTMPLVPPLSLVKNIKNNLLKIESPHVKID